MPLRELIHFTGRIDLTYLYQSNDDTGFSINKRRLFREGEKVRRCRFFPLNWISLAICVHKQGITIRRSYSLKRGRRSLSHTISLFVFLRSSFSLSPSLPLCLHFALLPFICRICKEPGAQITSSWELMNRRRESCQMP